MLTAADGRGLGVRLLAIENAPDPALLAVADVERPVGRLGHAIGASVGFAGIHQLATAGESAGEDFEFARGLPLTNGWKVTL